MELAKIRNKAQAEAERGKPDGVGSDISGGSQPPALTLPDDLFDGPDVAFPGPAMMKSQAVSVRFDPLAMIIAGREADQSAGLRSSSRQRVVMSIPSFSVSGLETRSTV